MIFSLDSIPSPIWVTDYDVEFFEETSEGRFTWGEKEGWWREA